MPNIQQQKKHKMVDSNDESNEDGSIIKAEPSPLTDQSATSLMTHNSSNAEEGGHIISSNGGAQICGGDGTVPMPLTSCWSPCSASSVGSALQWYEMEICPYCNQKCRKPRRLLDCLHFVCEECVPEQCLQLDNLDPDEIRCPNCSQVAMSSISGQSTESSRVEICTIHKEKLMRFCLSCDRLVCMKCVESDEHREHNSLPLDNELKSVCRQRLEQLGKKAEQKAQLLEHAKETIPKRKKMLHLSYDKCCEKIENSFTYYGHVLVQVKAQLLAELLNDREAAEQYLDSIYEKIGLKMPTFKRAIRSAHFLLERGDAAELYLGRSDLRQQLKFFAQSLPETNEKIELHFVPLTNATFKKKLQQIVGTIGSRSTALLEGEEPNMLANEQQPPLPTAQVNTVTELVADGEHLPASTQIQHQAKVMGKATAESFLRCKEKLHLSYNQCREKIENAFGYYGHVLIQVKAQLLDELLNNRDWAEQYLHNLYDNIDNQLASFEREFRRQKAMVENYELMELCLDKFEVRMMLKLIIDAFPEANYKIELHFNAPTAEFKKKLQCIVGIIESRSMLLLEDDEPNLLGNKLQLSLSAPLVSTVTAVDAGREKYSFNLSGTSMPIHHQLGKRSHPASTSEDVAPPAKRTRANEAVSTPTEFLERFVALKARGVHTWTVEEVSGWASFVTGSESIGKRFAEEEVDGSSLLCLQFEQFESKLKIKLGPLAKIWKSLEALKEKR